MPRIAVTLYQPAQAPATTSFDVETIVLGRAADCTIPIKDRYLSRRHAEMEWANDSWVLRDHGSANGTFVNGVRVTDPVKLTPGDRITLGDAEVVIDSIGDTVSSSPQVRLSDGGSPNSTISMPYVDVGTEEKDLGKASERLRTVNRLAMELIEDRPMSELFDFIIDKIMDVMSPSRAALALLAPDRESFVTMKLRCKSESDSNDLTISRTLLREVVEERRVLSFTDVSQDENLAQAKSIIGQSIRSALCAPLIVGEKVLGVLYLDYLITQRVISEEDAKLAGQVARVAAIKLETTRLREEAIAKAKMDEELKTAYVIQSRLLPAASPSIDRFQFAGYNRPCRTVSGDYYDFVTRPDGRIYFIIADVSGKGITAALVMASLATAFSIFTQDDPSPAELVSAINRTLAPKTAPTKFATLFAGVLDPSTGLIRFTNAGHTPPLWLRDDSITALNTTDMVVGLFPQATYRDQEITMRGGEALVLFTDGVIEAENDDGKELGHDRVIELAERWRGCDAPVIINKLEQDVLAFAGSNPLGDDVTILSLYCKA